MDEFSRLLAEAEFEQAVAAVQAEQRATVPYTRVLEGYPDWLLLTDAQWESYDGWNALQDELDRKYGQLRSFASMRATARRIW